MNKSINEELKDLINKGWYLYYAYTYSVGSLTKQQLQLQDVDPNDLPNFILEYEDWYTHSLFFIKKILPDRLNDFKMLYKDDNRKDITKHNYSIYDGLIGYESHGRSGVLDGKAAVPKLLLQINILGSIQTLLDSSIIKFSQLLSASIFDSEVKSAQELLNKGFTRASGVIAGVVLEKHLKDIIINHNITAKKKNPSINDFNELLKQNEIVDIPTWRKIQFLGDVRNLCGHSKDQTPTNEQVQDLINGVSKIIKTVF